MLKIEIINFLKIIQIMEIQIYTLKYAYIYYLMYSGDSICLVFLRKSLIIFLFNSMVLEFKD